MANVEMQNKMEFVPTESTKIMSDNELYALVKEYFGAITPNPCRVRIQTTKNGKFVLEVKFAYIPNTTAPEGKVMFVKDIAQSSASNAKDKVSMLIQNMNGGQQAAKKYDLTDDAKQILEPFLSDKNYKKVVSNMGFAINECPVFIQKLIDGKTVVTPNWNIAAESIVERTSPLQNVYNGYVIVQIDVGKFFKHIYGSKSKDGDRICWDAIYGISATAKVFGLTSEFFVQVIRFNMDEMEAMTNRISSPSGDGFY